MTRYISNGQETASITVEINTVKIPQKIKLIAKTMSDAGFHSYLVGGCVRDLILDRKPKDWDFTTNAKPEEIQSLFNRTYYENTYGTVGVVIEDDHAKNETEAAEAGSVSDQKTNTLIKEAGTLDIIEITPYRTDGDYKDGRHPTSVDFGTDLHGDLNRRDFTINALAYDLNKDILVDDFNGLKDIEEKVLRTVGDPDKRFTEDGLRLLRAIRLAAELGFTINIDTETSISKNSEVLSKIAQERIRDEFVKMLCNQNAVTSIFLLQKLGLMKYIIPELEEGLHMEQNQAHSYSVYEHLLRSMQCAVDKEYPVEIRIAALLHDIGKPRSRRFSEEKKDYTFYGHEVIGAKMTKKILERLKFSRETIDYVEKLVRWHMFFSDTGQITHSAVRRMIANVGKEHIWDLINLRICDRVGTGRPKEEPYRLRRYITMIEEVLRDPVSVSMLKIDGNTMISELDIAPGPKIGFMLNILLGEVIEDPTLNTAEYLVSRVTELNDTDESTLKVLSKKAVDLRNMVEEEEVQSIHKKNRV